MTIEHPALNQGRIRYDHLLGQKYDMGTFDCLWMLRSMFKDNLNIHIADYARPKDWWVHGYDFYNELYPKEGFKLMEDLSLKELRPFDVFLIAIPDERNRHEHVANHCGIYVGDGKMVHHRPGKNSEVINYRGVYKDYTTAIIRHKKVPNLINTKESSVELMEYLLPHKRQLLMGALNDRTNKPS